MSKLYKQWLLFIVAGSSVPSQTRDTQRPTLTLVSRGRGGGVRLGLRVHGGPLVSHLGDVSVITVGGVLDVLDATVGKGNGIGALGVTGAVGGLLGIEVGARVVICDGVGEGVGGDLVRVGLGRGVVSGGVGNFVDHRGGSVCGGRGVGGSGVDGVMDNRSSVHGVMSDGVGNNSVVGQAVVGDGMGDDTVVG